MATALLDAAGDWLKARGMTYLRGQVNPSTAESMGTLLDAYDLPPAILNGRLFPTGLLKVLWYQRRIDLLRVVMAGIRH